MYLDENVDTEMSGPDSFNSTLEVDNVGYEDDGLGYYCNASGCNTSMTAYLTGNCASEYV